MAEKMNNAASKVSDWQKNSKGIGDFLSKIKQGIKGQFSEIGTVFTNLKSMGGSLVSILGSIATALGTTTAALVGTATAVGLVTAAVVGGIIVYKKYFSLSAKLKEVEEEVENAASAVESTKQKYDDLLSAKENYDGLQKSLENLTKGTEDWSKALMESNNQVLELLKNYPLLAQYLNSDDG